MDRFETILADVKANDVRDLSVSPFWENTRQARIALELYECELDTGQPVITHLTYGPMFTQPFCMTHGLGHWGLDCTA